jgi:TRAP-type C4-dicarboxylate transport system permease large subunit
MRNHEPREETARVLLVAAALWGSVIAVGALEGAFTRFEAASVAALAVFVSLFAVASYFLDPQLRAYANGMDTPRAAMLGLALATAFGVALGLGSVAFAVFFAPLASVAGVAAVTRPRRAPRSASSAKSPGARPAGI